MIDFARAHSEKELLLELEGLNLLAEDLVVIAGAEVFRVTAETRTGDVVQLAWCPATSSFEAVKVQQRSW